MISDSFGIDWPSSPPMWHFTFLMTVLTIEWLELWNEQANKCLTKPNLAVKRDVLLPKNEKVGLKEKKCFCDRLSNPYPQVSRIIWITLKRSSKFHEKCLCQFYNLTTFVYHNYPCVYRIDLQFWRTYLGY